MRKSPKKHECLFDKIFGVIPVGYGNLLCTQKDLMILNASRFEIY